MSIILGIDPGSRVTGYGIIAHETSGVIYLDSGCIRTTSQDFSTRLLEIYEGISRLMREFEPKEVAIESVFMHINVNSALKLGHARGVAMLAATTHHAKVSEYSPRKVKQAIVGYGAAEKSQVQQMVSQFLSLNKTPQADAADALAIAICHVHMKKNPYLFLRRKSL